MKKGIITDYAWRRKRIILCILCVLLLFTIPAFIVFFYSIRHVTYLGVSSQDHPLQNIFPADKFSLTDEKLKLSTADGLTLWCSEVKVSNPKAIMIYLTDMKEPSVTYFFGHASWMKKKGLASFLLETRAHSKSSGIKQGFGISEVEDVRAVLNYISEQEEYRNLPIIIQGLGTGGAAAISSCGVFPEVTACIAMSPIASVETQADIIMKKLYFPQFLRDFEKKVIHVGLGLSYGFDDANEYSPMVQIMKASQKKMLVVSAMYDKVVPIDNTYALKQLESGAEFWIRETSDHCVIKDNDFISVEQDSEYCTYIWAFINKILEENKKEW